MWARLMPSSVVPWIRRGEESLTHVYVRRRDIVALLPDRFGSEHASVVRVLYLGEGVVPLGVLGLPARRLQGQTRLELRLVS